jgi:cell division control protein 45
MVNSNYLMTRLGLWNDKGLKKLHEILTTIGISLVESKQLFKYMQKESR